MKVLEPGEFNTLLKELPEHSREPTRDRVAILAMHDLGLRISEALGLHVSDVNTTTGFVTIRTLKQHKAVQDVLAVSPRLLESVTAYLQDRVEGPTLLTTRNGTPIHRTHYNELLKIVGIDALGKPVHPHMLRHTSGTEVYEKMGLVVAKNFLRHRAISSTEKYTHVRPKWAQDVAQTFGEE